MRRGRPHRPARARGRLRHRPVPRRAGRPRQGLGRRPVAGDARGRARPRSRRRAQARLRRGAALQGRLVRAGGDVARRPPRRPAARLRRAPPRALAGRKARDRDLRPGALRRVLAERALPVARGDRPRALPDRRAAGDRARRRRFRRAAADATLAGSPRSTASGALERIRGKHISTFDLLEDDEYAAGSSEPSASSRSASTTGSSGCSWPPSGVPCKVTTPIRTPLTRSREAEKES